ncbi:hypothetical protein T484DRAFT_1848859 [Baffinella frigidus]|nr:hypothetical protein T484DRAFT_1848859 [Cryptophyta sp. CCMP2293]
MAAPMFVLPEVEENPLGWGPVSDSIPEQLRYLPFAPFSKNERLGRACEWTFSNRDRDRKWPRNNTRGDAEPSPFVIEQVDEEGFHLVDTKQIMKPKWGPGARRGGMGFQVPPPGNFRLATLVFVL